MPESAPTRIDPQATEAMKRLAALSATPVHTLAVAEVRRLYREARLGPEAWHMLWRVLQQTLCASRLLPAPHLL